MSRSKAAPIAFAVLIISLLAGGYIVQLSEARMLAERRAVVMEIGRRQAYTIQRQLDSALSSTYTLAAIVREDGAVNNFDTIADELITRLPVVDSLQLAPDAVVRQIYPLRGNEEAIGHDLLADPQRRADVQRAIDSRRLTLSGPLELRQGGQAVIGQLAVFTQGEQGEDVFWGLAVAVIRIPTLLDTAHVSDLLAAGYTYELATRDASTGQLQAFSRSGDKLTNPVLNDIEVPNGTWVLAVTPPGVWHNLTWLRIEVTLVALFVTLFTWLTYSTIRNRQQLEVEVELATAELLTFNRRLEAEAVERAHLMHALSQSQAQYQHLVENLGDAVFQTDAAGRWTFLTPAWTTLTGFTVEQSLGIPFLDYVHPDDRQRNAELFAPLIARQKDYCRHEVQYLTNDGGFRWVEVFARLLLDEEGQVVGTAGTLRDRTESHIADQRLRESEERFRTVVSNAPIICFTLDEHGLFTLSEGKGLEVLGRSPGQVVGKPITEVYADNPDILADISLVLNGQTIAKTRLVQGRWFQTWYAPLRRADGTMGGVIGVAFDVTKRIRAEEALRESNESLEQRVAERTAELRELNNQMWHELFERKRIEAALRESEERYRAISAMTMDYVFALRVEADSTLEMEWVAGADMTSNNARWLIPASDFIEAVHSDDRAALQRQISAAMAGQEQSLELRVTSKRSGPRWIRIFLRPQSNAQGQIERLLGATQDEMALENERSQLAQRVAERTAELSAANAELARAARLKDEFLASMSHELRTPLNAILGLSEALQRNVYGEMNAKQLSSLRTIAESGGHLLALINDILDLSKIEAGKLTLNIDTVGTMMVCQASVRMIKQAAHSKKINVSLNLDPQATTVRADARRLKQMLVNLLSNAVKFTPEGGSIGLDVETEPGNQTIRFTVWDTGIGIPREKLGQLFRPFVQLDSGLARQYEGTGLGLSLVYRMARLHGGSIAVVSEVDKGSRFSIILPWSEQMSDPPELPRAPMPRPSEPATAPAPALHTLPTEQPLVLLAEDQEANIGFITDFLQSCGYRVMAVRNGRDVGEAARSTNPAIVLMDIQMPGVDGLTAIRELRADPATAHLPIIAVTALAMPGDRDRCLAAGANSYLSKPVSLRTLIESIEALGVRAGGPA
jgi:PAS domain S-box-containing protein